MVVRIRRLTLLLKNLERGSPFTLENSPKILGYGGRPHLHGEFLPPPLWWYSPPLVKASSFPLNYLFILFQNLSHSPKISFLHHEPRPNFLFRWCDHHPCHHHKTMKWLSLFLPAQSRKQWIFDWCWANYSAKSYFLG